MRFVHRFANYVMQGRKQAITTGLLLSLLPPLFSWLADVVVGLVSLRKGMKEGALVLLWTILPSVILLNHLDFSIWLYSVLGGHLLSYGLALLLRHSASWAILLEVLLALGLITLVGFHVAIPDIAAIWLKQLPQQMAFFATTATGITLSVLFLASLWVLLIARWLQAALYNPGQLLPEILSIRISKASSLIMLSCVIVAVCLDNPLAKNSLVIVTVIGGLAGLSILEALIKQTQIALFWKSLFWVLLFIFLPYLIWILIGLVWVDSVHDLRKHWNIHPSVKG
jgi:hypothetical protein